MGKSEDRLPIFLLFVAVHRPARFLVGVNGLGYVETSLGEIGFRPENRHGISAFSSHFLNLEIGQHKIPAAARQTPAVQRRMRQGFQSNRRHSPPRRRNLRFVSVGLRIPSHRQHRAIRQRPQGSAFKGADLSWRNSLPHQPTALVLLSNLIFPSELRVDQQLRRGR